MNNNILQVCPQNSAYKYRPDTDVLFKMPSGSFKYSGIIDSTIKFIENFQLIQPETWALFVRQFKGSYPDDMWLTWKGEYWGKMMRGACFTYEYTKNDVLYKVLEETVKDLMKTQDAFGRISTYSVEKEFDGWDLWCRKYVMLGFEYFLDICRDDSLIKEIINCMCRHADYIMSKVGKKEDGKKEITSCTRNYFGLNSSSILEPYVRLYNLTGEQKYLDYAKYIVDNGGISEGNIFELAYEGKVLPYEYPTNKAYEMMSCFEGLLEYYRVTGDEKHKTAVVNFAKLVLQSDITIIGCSGCTHELFDYSTKRQTVTDYNYIMQETCVTVTWMKFAHQVLCVTGDVSFADALEQSTYNAMLGAVNHYGAKTLTGLPVDSYIPLFMSSRARSTGGFQPMENETASYGCCACIGAAGTALMGLSSVMQAQNGIYFNLYLPGFIDAKTPAGTSFKLKVDTKYPADGKINIFVKNAKGDEEFTLAFRIPSWCEKASMKVCGQDIKVQSGTYACVTRRWNCCDKIELDFEMKMKVVLPPLGGWDENSKYLVALQKGPVVFARDARLGEDIDSIVDFDYNENLEVEILESHSASFPTEQEYKVKMKDGSYITVIDFQSAGKTWNNESNMTVWMPTKNFWEVDFAKQVTFSCRLWQYCIDTESGYIRHTKSGQLPPEPFTIENNGDGTCFIRTSGGKYLGATFHELTNTYILNTGEKGQPHQLWTLHHVAVNHYRLENVELGLVSCYNWSHNVFSLYDPDRNDVIVDKSCQNNAFVTIKNI